MSFEEISFMPATVLAAGIRSKRLSAVEVVRAFLERITQLNPALNAYVTVCQDLALEQATQADEQLLHGIEPPPLHGVPFSVKDVVFTAGVRTTAGSRIHENHVPAEDATSVARLRKAGAILLGKTNTPEFGYKATTENLLFGPTRNPWKRDYTAGGSSGGASAATAAGLTPLALGTDGGGSIRIPASFCAVFGLKPTFGLIPTVPGFPGWRSLSHTGPITRNVRDAALMLDVMAGPHEADRLSIPRAGTSYLAAVETPILKLRLGYSARLGFALVEPEVVKAIEDALPAFEEIGHTVQRVEVDLGAAKEIFETVVSAENTQAHLKDVEEKRELMDDALVKFIERGIGIGAGDYIAANRRRDELAARLARYFSDYDLLLTPTVAVAPFAIGEPPREILGVKIDALGWIPFTYPFNLTGNPAASVPCGVTANGLPIGLQVVGPRYADSLVLNLCAQFEALRPWSHNRPPID